MMSMKRLRVEHVNLQKEPVPYAIASPRESNILEWRFIIKGTEGTDYDGGFYHGKLTFPPQYPMSPPSVMFMTPSGRFETNKRVCLSISDFHPETWSPLWTVGTILTGIVSFMNSDEMTTGGLAGSSSELQRKKWQQIQGNGSQNARRTHQTGLA
jgi:ubiquitin-conjugating enzyme E2 J2